MKRQNDPQKLETLEAMAAQELEALLREELAKEPIDIDAVHRILSALEIRSSPVCVITPEIEMAFAKLQKRRNARLEARSGSKRGYTGRRTWAVAATALCLAVFLALPVFGSEGFGCWTEDYFSLIFPENPKAEPQEGYEFHTEHPGLQQLYDAVSEISDLPYIVPTWLPEGCVLDTLSTTPFSVMAVFVNGDDIVSVSFFANAYESTVIHTKSEGDPVILEYNDVEHYIFQHGSGTSIVWMAGKADCSVKTSYSSDVAQKIILSIYKGE